jgi:serine/threonine-protein kinase
MSLCSVDATALKRVEDPLLGKTIAGKYRIEQLIRRGGMGAVYRGKHVMMDKTVAIKVLRPSLSADDDVVARFSREAKAASRISHPHAVSVTDFGEAENGLVFLVMEYLDGRTLKDIIKTEGPLPLPRVVEIIKQVAGALDAAHAEDVVHRDLKSENIMLLRRDGGDSAKVLDFGIAKILQPAGGRDAGITSPNLVIGTPHYMSPEQCSESSTIDGRSDVYSLGIIVFEMLTGRVPFLGESSTSIMMKHVQDPPPSLLAVRPDLPSGVEDVVTRALAKQPDDRFPTTGDLAEALSEAAAATVASGGAFPRQVYRSDAAGPPLDDADEVTVVRPRLGGPGSLRGQEPPATMNPWKIIVPSAVALVLVFAGVFFFTRNPGPAQTQPQTPGQTGLSVDPNSQPVQPLGVPSGASEQGIQPNSIATPAGGNANINANRSPQPSPTSLTGDFDANLNGNDNASERGNRNARSPRELPSPGITPVSDVNSMPPPPAPKPSPSAQPSLPKPAPSPSSEPNHPK